MFCLIELVSFGHYVLRLVSESLKVLLYAFKVFSIRISGLPTIASDLGIAFNSWQYMQNIIQSCCLGRSSSILVEHVSNAFRLHLVSFYAVKPT